MQRKSVISMNCFPPLLIYLYKYFSILLFIFQRLKIFNFCSKPKGLNNKFNLLIKKWKKIICEMI